MLYDDMTQTEGKIVNELFDILLDKQEIDTIEDIGTIIIPGKYFLEIIRKKTLIIFQI